MPIADINTNSEVEPAEINGSGKPVGGIEPVTTQTLRTVWIPSTQAMPMHRNLE